MSSRIARSPFALPIPFERFWKGPLSFREITSVALILFLGGTVYCQLYCLIAFQAMHGMAMPLSLSMERSGFETIPALAAFELSKRSLGSPTRLGRFARVATMLALVGALTVGALLILRQICGESPMPVRS